MGKYDVQQVCLNGHQITDRYNGSPERRNNHCSICGEKTLHQCPECKSEIKGYHFTPGVVVLGGTTSVPTHCDNCGSQFPWAGKKKTHKNKDEFSSRKNSMNKFEIGTIITVILAIIGGAVSFGRLDGRINALEKDKNYSSLKSEIENGILKIQSTAQSGQNLIQSENARSVEQIKEYGVVPVGTIIWVTAIWSEEEAKKRGYLIANGQSVSTITYENLYKQIKNIYGNSEAKTINEFVLPDLRGLFIRGYDKEGVRDPEGKTRKFGGVQNDELGSHTHPFPVGTWHGYGGRNAKSGNTDGDHTTKPRGGKETRPKNIALLPLIKF
jgi:hypothetical protein